MDIEKTKAEFEKSECFKRFEDVVQHTFFDFGTYCIRTDVPRDVEKKIEKLVSGLIFSWKAWKEAKAQAVPEWISVKDQLPPSDPYNREYWVYETLNNKVQHDYWVCPDTGLDQDFEPFFNNWPREVTHWMPMVKYPKPPVQAQEPTND